MKRGLRILVPVALCVLLVLAVCSCGETTTALSAPIITLKDDTISWQAVENASAYCVRIGDLPAVETKELSYTIQVDAPGNYPVSVTALPGEERFCESERSNQVIYVATETQLAKPSLTLSGKVVSWKAVERATKYEIFVNGGSRGLQTDLQYTLTDTDAGEYSITVKAKSDSALFTDSDMSYAVIYTISKTELTPPILTLTGATVTWDAVANASSYEVFINNVSVGKTDQLSYVITETLVGSYTVKVIAVTENANYSNSVFSNEITYVVSPRKLNIPVLSLNGTTVSWSAIENATSYEIFINGESRGEQTALSFEITETIVGEYRIQVVAKTSDTQFAASDRSEMVIYTVEPLALDTPKLRILKDKVTWDEIPNADGYEIYVDGIKQASIVTGTQYIASHTSDIQVVALGSGQYKNSEKSVAIHAVIKGFEAGNETVAGETFNSKVVLTNTDIAKITIKNNDTQFVWLRFFVKATAPTEYRIQLEGQTRKTIIDWNLIGGENIAKDNYDHSLTGTTAVGYEYVAVRLDLCGVELTGEYTFVLETRTEGTTLTITGLNATQMLSDKYSMKYTPNEYIFADNVAVGSFGLTEDDLGSVPYYYSNFVPYGCHKVFWGGWIAFSYSNLAPDTEHYNYNDDNKYQAMSRYVAFDDLGDNDCYQIRFKHGNDGRDSNMLWKFTAYDPTTGKTYVLKDWFVWISERQGENETSFHLDAEASKAISGKNVILTIQCQAQENVTGITNRMYINNWGIKTYKAPVASGSWVVADNENGSEFNQDANVRVNADSFVGELILKGANNVASLTTQIDASYTSNAWLIFFARAGAADSGAVVAPSTMLKLSVVIGDGSTIVLMDWTKLGGTASTINLNSAGENPNINYINDGYEIFMISLDNYAYNYAGKQAVFTLEQQDSEDGSVQELHVVGFGISRRNAIVNVNGTYAGMSSWTTNWDTYTEFTDYPLPAGFLRVSATNEDTFKYQGEATTVSFAGLSAAQTLKMNFAYGNYGNYGSMLHKLTAIDCDTGATYTLIDWEFIGYPGGGDASYSKTIDADVVTKLAGKSNIQLVWQFADTQKLDCPFNNRLYLTNIGFVIE